MSVNSGGEFAPNQVSGGVKEKQYAFDYVFDESTDQKTVFEKSTQFLIEGVTDGYNATVFAYGATGAGKTHTMLGKPSNHGIFGNSFEELFRNINEQSKDKDFKVKMSFIEIYNEAIFDLLMPSDKGLELREDATKGIHVAGISEIKAGSTSEVLELLYLGNQNRSTEPTDANEESSRSHAILLVTVEHKEKESGPDAEVKVGKFSLIDLAGSERAANTNNSGIRLVEGANINRSLLALGNCITLLFQNSEKKTKSYIPYRDSKLTRLLKDSLGGNSRTVMIANISPANNSYDETSNTLKYASRAKNIKTDVKRNVLSVSLNASKYQSIISNLKKQVSDLKDELAGQETNSSMSKLVPKDKDTKSFDQLKNEMDQNFQKELENRKQYIENERIAIEASVKMFQYKTEFEKSNRENGKNNIKTKQLEENQKIEQKLMDKCAESRKKIDDAWENLKKYREKLPSIWKKKKMKDMQLTMLQILFQNHVTSVENAILKNKQETDEGRVKSKELELKCLHEILHTRDSVIDQTKKQLNINQMELVIDDGDTFETAESITKRLRMSFPSIGQNTPMNVTSKNRYQSVNVRIEKKEDYSSDKNSVAKSQNKHIASSLKLVRPVIRNNYISNNRYGGAASKNKSQFKVPSCKNTNSLPKLNVQKLDNLSLSRKPSIIMGMHPKKPYLNVKGPRKMFDRPPSTGGTSITSDRTTTSMPHVVRSDNETSTQRKKPLSYQDAIKQMKNKPDIKASDRMRLNKFKKKNFIYNTSAKKLSLADKYKPIPQSNFQTPSFLNRVGPSGSPNIQKMSERKEGSNIPVMSHTERMKSNIQRLNLLPVTDNNIKSSGPIKSILKKTMPPTNTISPMTSNNLKANTLANSMGRNGNY